jgi:hypothetical protein
MIMIFVESHVLGVVQKEYRPYPRHTVTVLTSVKYVVAVFWDCGAQERLRQNIIGYVKTVVRNLKYDA